MNNKTMMTYIEESPKRIDYVVKNRVKLTKKLVDLYLSKNHKTIWLVGCGSSYNGAIAAKPFMIKYLDQDVKVVTSSNFMYGDNHYDKDDFILFISQSGCSTNTIEAIKDFKKKGNKAYCLTGNLDGDFKEVADKLFDWGCGQEDVGFVTKGCTILALYLMLFAYEASYKKGLIDKTKYNELLKDFNNLAKANKNVKENTQKLIKNNYKDFLSINTIYSIGYSVGYSVCNEGALKLAETIKKPSFFYEGDEFAHGPNNQLDPTYTIFFVDSFDKSSKRLMQIYKATRKVSDRAFALTNSKEVDDRHAVRVNVNIKEGLLSPVYSLVFFQTIAYVVTDALNNFKLSPLIYEYNKVASTKTKNVYKVMPLIDLKH